MLPIEHIAKGLKDAFLLYKFFKSSLEALKSLWELIKPK
jgi:hypothetical protein